MKSITRSISIILPVYNELENLQPLIVEIEAAMSTLAKSYEIIAIDDHSTDGSRDWLLELAQNRPHLRVLCFRSRSGQSAAFDAGIQNARGDVIVTLDADGQNNPADIPEMVHKLDEGYDVVAGWRKNRRDNLWLRTIPSVIANRLIRKVTHTKLHDLGCSLKVFRAEIVKELRLYGDMHRFLGVLVEQLGAEIAEVVVDHRPRLKGKSKYGLGRVYRVLLDLLTVWFFKTYRSRPLHLLGGIAAVTGGASTLLGAFVVYQKIFFEVSLNRNPLFFICIFLTMGCIQFLTLGLLAELIIRTYFESQKKTPYLIWKSSVAQAFDGRLNSPLLQNSI